MTGKFFRTLDPAEKSRIAATTELLAARLTAWSQPYHSVRPERIPAVALLTSIVAPQALPVEALPTMKISFWIFGVDDLADEQQLPLNELRRRMERWYTVALQGAAQRGLPEQPDELSSMLLEVRSDLARYPLFGSLRERWALEVRRLVEAMADEYQFSLQYQAGGSKLLPPLDVYLLSGTASIGVPLWALSVWIVSQDASILRQLALIYRATQAASTAVRLYNDLISFEKEQAENTVNAVLIWQQQARQTACDESLAGARRSIQLLAESYAQRSLDIVRQIHTTTGRIEETLRRTVEFHADFYSDHDYNTTLLSQVPDLLTGQAGAAEQL